ncbi:MAG: HAMP domain-containing histidine kinase [Cyanobacteria bacterium REEB459]|nr:HAMP domain-containing histidine kinase [Cyanobacteria bacterium REEB459]
MFQATRQRLALWYTAVTAVLLLVFAVGFYAYVRTTLVERVDDTLNHVVEIIGRSLVIEVSQSGDRAGDRVFTSALNRPSSNSPPVTLQVNVEASFGTSARAVEDDHIDLEWFSPQGKLLWSTMAATLPLPLRVNPAGETVRVDPELVFRQITERVQMQGQVLGYLRVSHPWFEVTRPSRRLMVDLALGTSLMVGTVAAMGWLLSGIAMAPVRDSYQQLRQFTADASHELRNPIAIIQTNAQVALLDPHPDLAIQQQQFQVIERLTRRLGRLVDDLLFLARQDSGLIALTPATLDLETLVEDVVEEQQVIAQEAGINLEIEAHHQDWEGNKGGGSCDWDPQWAYRVWGDSNQLTRLLTNLVSNALQFTPPGGLVKVRLGAIRQHGQPWLQLVIQDTGIGIAPEALTHVFDRFYRADPSRLRYNDQGTGLGLAIAKAIVDHHRGTIQIHSHLNQGTEVTVLLPLVDRSA